MDTWVAFAVSILYSNIPRRNCRFSFANDIKVQLEKCQSHLLSHHIMLNYDVWKF